ncbi:MAG: hypothetical protein DRP51_03390 [Candidatus Zixiibacteriota bacterium]|nr:MAG: hypothetical protein DRP51_03390 [candidate division Zixibacteria bacterium]
MKSKILLYLILFLLSPIFLLGNPISLDKKISLQFEEVPISTILTMIAQRHDLNIVQSSEISAEISLQLDNVSLGDALNAILASNGYNYFYSGDIIVVKPLEMDAPGELQVKTFTLKYLPPSAAVGAIEKILSPKGKIKTIKISEDSKSGTNTAVPTQILVFDYPEIIRKAEDLINDIDIPQPQIAIEVRMIETNVDDEKNVGFSWPTSLGARLHGLTTSSSSTTTSRSSSEALAQMQLPDGGWQWGILSVEETSAILNFLNKKGNSKLLSNPRITTLNNYEAEIRVTTIVPIQTINRFSEGGAVQDIVTFQDEEIGITLKVTPHICENDEIILDVEPTVAEIIGYSGPIDNQKPITSQRSVRARIIVTDKETAALGGLMKENKIETVQKVFLLGSIPIIGNLFKHKTTKTSNTELLILITPTILRK